ncbi:hypothetical protein ACI65C_011649, partial [Semiaphis heraclei]
MDKLFKQYYLFCSAGTHPKVCIEEFEKTTNWRFPRLLISNNKKLASPSELIGALCTFLGLFVIFIFFDTKNNRHRLLPLAGLGVFVLVGFIFSKHRGHVNWTTVASGLATQITIGMLTIRWPVGRSIVQVIGELADKFFSFAYVGAKVTYGHELIDNYGVFAFKVLSVLFFMCFVIEILFYYGIIQTIVIKLGWCLQQLLGTTAAESVNTCASVFLGMSEAPIIIKPYLADLTESEIHAVMMGGFSTVAGMINMNIIINI